MRGAPFGASSFDHARCTVAVVLVRPASAARFGNTRAAYSAGVFTERQECGVSSQEEDLAAVPRSSTRWRAAEGLHMRMSATQLMAWRGRTMYRLCECAMHGVCVVVG